MKTIHTVSNVTAAKRGEKQRGTTPPLKGNRPGSGAGAKQSWKAIADIGLIGSTIIEQTFISVKQINARLERILRAPRPPAAGSYSAVVRDVLLYLAGFSGFYLCYIAKFP